MGQFEPAKNLLMKVKEIAFIGKGTKPANKKTLYMLKSEGDETEARIAAHTQEENMELNDKQVGDIAAKVVELIKAAEPAKVVPNPEEKKPQGATPAAATDDMARATPPAKDVGGMTEHLSALKAMMPVAGNEDSEMTEEEAIAQMESALKLFEQAHAVVEKCSKMKKGETLKPATAEELQTKPQGDNPAPSGTVDETLELSEGELEDFKKSVRKEAGMDETAA